MVEVRMGLKWQSVLVLMVGGGVCALLSHSTTRAALSNLLLSWRISRLIKKCKRKVFVINTAYEWNEIYPQIKSEVYGEAAGAGAAVLGLDCEWVQVGSHRRPVSLLQLATPSGMCVLVRLSYFKPHLIPPSLKSLLEDVRIIKGGVEVHQDKQFLEIDYPLFKVDGCVDLRHLALVYNDCVSSSSDEVVVSQLGLNGLTQTFLGHSLDKDWRVRASDWEADSLTNRQVNYAAKDALVGVHLLMVLCAKIWKYNTSDDVRPNWWLPLLLPSSLFNQHLMNHIYKTCHQFINVKFNRSNKSLSNYASSNYDSGSVISQKMNSKSSQPSRAFTPRKAPLYHNCQLIAPDDAPLCTCDPKKAQWYLDKGLGVLVQEDPMVVRLNFEPGGRPHVECEDGMYYVQERQNLCVVCGLEHSYIKKNIVPHEYRRHFPSVLKDHQSHDVVLMCIECHKISNLHDSTLKRTLARECNAPIDREEGRRVSVDPTRRAVRNAAWALLKSRHTIPEARVSELEEVVKNYFNTEDLSDELLEEGAGIDPREWNESYQAHGKVVCEAYHKIGLVHLQQRWRRHFLDTMNPKHLPQYWSITHNLNKMSATMSALGEDHPDYETYKTILIGQQ